MLNILTTNNNHHNNKSKRKLWEVIVMVYGSEGAKSFPDAYVSPRLIEWYTFNMYSFLHVNHTSIRVKKMVMHS